jgi:hypothetical protein
MSAAVSEPARVRGLDGVWSRAALDSMTQLRLFAALVFRDAPENHWLHVWAARRRADGRLVAFRRDPLAFVRDVDALAAQALVWHARGLEVFAGLLPRSEPRPDNRAVGEGALLWADVDELDALGKLEALCSEHPAHYLAASGGGGSHAAWLLDGPRPGRELAAACRRLAGAVGGDLAVCHPGASLRLPGTRNGKPGAGECRLLAADLALPAYALETLVSGLPEAAGGTGGQSGTALGEGGKGGRAPWRGDDPLARIPPPLYVAALCGVAVPQAGAAISCPLPGHEDAHPSFMVYAEPRRGWRCFSHPGGSVGGRIYDLVSALAGGPVGQALRGGTFLAVKRHARRAISPGALDRQREADERTAAVTT